MRYRLFGPTGLRVSEVFLGAMRFGASSAQDNRRVLDRFVDLGGNVIDTAVYYGDGESETLLGELLHGRRDRFVLASKGTVSRDRADPNAAGNHHKNLTRSLETTLRRLRTDYLDVFWTSMWDRHTPVEETMRALDDAVRAGKLLYIGASNTPAWVVARGNALAEWRGWTSFAGIQVPYSLLNRDIERELLPMAAGLGLAVAAWGPLGHGILADPLDQLSGRELAAARAVREVATDLNATPAQVALSWTRARSAAVHPILGARTVEQLDDALGGLELTLPADVLARLDAATESALGYPHDFIARNSEFVFGETFRRLDGGGTAQVSPPSSR